MQWQYRVALALLFIFQVILLAVSREIHVTHNGHDGSFCGRSTQPCQTVRYAVRISHSEDTILVDYAQGLAYEECLDNKPILIQRSLTIRGMNGSAEIRCQKNGNLFHIREGWSTSIRSLHFVNLTLSNSGVALTNFQTDIKVHINACTFRNNSVGILINQLSKCFLFLNNSSFHNHHSSGIESLSCKTSIFTIANSLFYSSSISQRDQFKKNHKYELFIDNCSFLGGNIAIENGLFVHSFTEITKIIITKTIFKNNLGLNHKGYLLRLKDKYDPTGKAVTFIKLDRLTFENNYWKKNLIYLEAPHAKEHSVSLENSLFKNNTGTMEFIFSPFEASRVTTKTFGSVNKILLKNNTFQRNHYFPHQPLAGTYATLLFNFGTYQVVECKFIDNRDGLSPSTGVISISDLANVTLQDCYFEHSQFDETAVQVFAYPNSVVKAKGNNTFNIIRLNEARTIFIHLPCNNLAPNRSATCGSVITAGILKFVCPQGFSALQQQVQRLKSHGQNETTAFTYLNVLCWPCPRKTYSLERGMVTFNFSNNTKMPAYKTSRIEGGSKQRSHTPNIECHECPRGGQCVLGYLKAKANFWGYARENKVRFIDCPHKYCCDSHFCPTYNTCHGRRTGTLCGQCPTGTSESLFSTVCRQNSKCNPTIFFPAAAILVIAYIIFFLYHEDIVHFLRKGLCEKLPSMSDRVDTKESGGCIKIIFYYYQTINLLLSSVGLEEKHEVVQRIDDFISDVFNLVVADISSFDCPLPSITPVSKTLMSHSLGFVLLVSLGFGCLMWKLCRTVTRRAAVELNNISSSTHLVDENDWDLDFSANNCRPDVEDSQKRSFTERALGAFTHISLLMYSATARLCLRLLHCVPYKNTKVLFIDGTMQCYQSFQYVLLGYAVMSVLPFCLVPFLGSYVLGLGLISVTQFLLGCLLPLPFCCLWLRLLLRNHAYVNGYRRHDQNSINKNHLAIQHVLSGPFRAHEAIACFPRSPLAWEGVLIFRRLVLILIFAFTYDSRWRTLYAMTACILILIIHLCVKPFKKRWENGLETASLATLVLFCGFTLVKALYRGEDYSSLYTNSTFMRSLNMVESVLIILPLAVVVIVVLILLLIRLIRLLGLCFRFGFRSIRSLFSD